MDLRELEITSENLEEVLQSLVSEVSDLDAVEKRLGLDFRNMTQLMRKYPHNIDLYHNGENVLTHIGWVMDDVAKLSATMDAEKRTLLKLTGLFHDLGKAYTYALNTEKKHTFYGHATKSVEIAEVLLAKHKEALGSLYQRVLDFTRLHDVFLSLTHARANNPGGSPKYVSGLLQEAIYREGLLEDLLTFAKADSARARSHENTLKDIEGVLDDVKRYEALQAAVEAERVRKQQLTIERMPAIQKYLEVEAPDAAVLLPDLQAVRKLLGTTKRYNLIKGIEAIIT
jgi:putative nucleotidyltransferase with HDIG domain